MEYLRFGLLGLATGSLYAMIALGVVVVYRSSGVLNFSAGATGAAGAYVFYELRDQQHIYWVIALFLGIVTGLALGALTQVVVVRLLHRASILAKLIATLGIMSLIQGFIGVVWGTQDLGQPQSFLPDQPSDTVHLFGSRELFLTNDRIVIIVIVVILALCLRLVYSKSLFGLATTAVAENGRVAAMGGWSPATISLINFCLAGMLSAAAAILIAPIVGLDTATLTLLVLPALAAALVGGFSSFALTVIGAMVIGILESEFQRFVTTPQLSGLSAAVPLLVIVAVAVVKGRSRLTRGEGTTHMPRPGSGRVPIPLLILGATVGVVLMIVADDSLATALTTTCRVRHPDLECCGGHGLRGSTLAMPVRVGGPG